MYQIAIANEQNLLQLKQQRLVSIAKTTLTLEQVSSAEISIAIVDDGRIHEINRQFLQHDEPTDVISFRLEDDCDLEPRCVGRRSGSVHRRHVLPGADSCPRGAGRMLEGEIVISAQWAIRTARQVGSLPHSEMALYLVHGLLHLCGYDDLTRRERQLMRRREFEVLAHCRIRYAAVDPLT